ncbi:MAG: DMT family transporter [Solirubrobacteraceae bacterium]
MSRSLAVLLTAGVGGLVAIQAPINSQLGKKVGTYQGALVSFTVGTVLLTAIVLVAGGGVAKIGEARHVAWYYLLGGVLGAAYVSVVLVTVRTLGAGGATAATITGQLTMAVIVDQFGLFNIPRQPITALRVLGVALLAVGVYLIVRE